MLTCPHCKKTVENAALTFCPHCDKSLKDAAKLAWPGSTMQLDARIAQKFLNFNEMITPVLVKIIYWLGVVLVILCGVNMCSTGKALSKFGGGGSLVIAGLAMIILGPILVRVCCESMIVLFEIHKNLVEINKKTK